MNVSHEFWKIQWLSRLLGLVLLLCACCGTTQAQQQENRVALVIGNSAYKQVPLRNPSNDARDMAARLRSLGFSVIERDNLQIRQIGSTLREFRAKLTPGSVALVFYAGHGLQIKGENYLPAVDAEIGGEEDVPNQSLAMRQIMDVLGDAKTRLNLVFLDACRDNPYARSFRSAARGLSKESAPSGTLISFATRPGSVAADGAGRNGVYTGALLEAMNDGGRPIEQVLKSVTTSVKALSKNQQEPWMEGSIEGDFCFGGCERASRPAVVVAQGTAGGADRLFWESIKDTKDANELRAYLNKFPGGLFAELAGIRLRGLEQAAGERTAAEAAQRAAQERPAPEAAQRATLERTVWRGNSSRGWEYQFEFMPNGVLKYSNWNGKAVATYENARWQLISNQLSLDFNNGFAIWQGVVAGANISGTAKNKNGNTWTWDFKQINVATAPPFDQVVRKSIPN